MKKKLLLIALLLFILFPFLKPVIGNADGTEKNEDGVIVLQAPKDDIEIYTRYKDNNFQLITKEATSLTGLKAALLNITGSIKELVWSGLMNLGKFNTAMVRYLFGFDLDTAIKEPILNLTANLASGMLSLASSIGIIAVMVIMLIKYIGEQRISQAFKVFGMTMLIFVGLVTLSSSNRNNSLGTTIVNIDNLVESKFVTVNPVFSQDTKDVPTSDDSTNNTLQSAGDMISAKIFRTNVYEPYLTFVYGTSNEETIRQKSVQYKNENYDRIGILLDNDYDSADSEKIFDSVTKYEAEELKNRTISWKNNLSLAMQGLFYLVLNLAQTAIYFILCLLRLILILLRWVLFPLMPILLLFSMFITEINAFKNGARGFITVVGLKGLVAFAMVFVASYMSLGYGMAADIDDPFVKIVTIAIFLVTPVGLYFFRSIIGKLITGQLTMSDVGNVVRNPYRTARKMNKASKEQAKLAKMRRKQIKEEMKRNRKKKNPPRYKLHTPNSSKQPFSDRRNEKKVPNTASPNEEKVPNNVSQNNPDSTNKENIGVLRRYKTEKPEKVPEQKTRTPRLSEIRKERSPERVQKTPNKLNQKFNQAHENSRYQDMAYKRYQPERQRIQKQAQERATQRQQEQARIVATGRSSKRSGQSTQATNGVLQKHAGNTHKRSGQLYHPKQRVEQPRGKMRNSGQTGALPAAKKTRQPNSEIQNKKTGQPRVDTKKIVPQKGVKRRRV
jgi:hypothetical protein